MKFLRKALVHSRHMLQWLEMKLISLNTWGGRAGKDALLSFLQTHAEVDIFCFQEMWRKNGKPIETVLSTLSREMLTGAAYELYHAIEMTLPRHYGYFRPHFYDFFGLALFVRKDLRTQEEGELFVYKERGYIAKCDIPGREYADIGRNLHYVTVETARGPLTFIHVHGLWNGDAGKKDTEDRLLQSDNIIRFLETLQNPFILCGDFNLLPETESLQRLERFGLRNLITEYGITSTRTKYYTKANRFADYVLVSPGITVKDFQVLPDGVSDHSPLYLEFE